MKIDRLNDYLKYRENLETEQKDLTTDSKNPYDLDLVIKEELTGDKPVDCSSETCNCQTKACHTYNVGSCWSCSCTNSACCR